MKQINRETRVELLNVIKVAIDNAGVLWGHMDAMNKLEARLKYDLQRKELYRLRAVLEDSM